MTISQLGRRDFLKLAGSLAGSKAVSTGLPGVLLRAQHKAVYHCIPVVELINGVQIKNVAELPGLREFVDQVADGNPDVVRGAWSAGKLAESVVQQPYGFTVFVSATEGVLTEFSVAGEVGNIGLLAHNTTETGRRVASLALGDEVAVVMGDRSMEHFRVGEVKEYRAHDPTSPYSNFSPIPDDGNVLSAKDLFDEVYRGPRRATFQTCIEKDGNASWGRLFVIADKEERTKPERSDLLG